MASGQTKSRGNTSARDSGWGMASSMPEPMEAPRRSMADRGPRVINRARRKGWITRELTAVLLFSFFGSLACLYVTAYARVTLQGLEYAQLSEKLKAAEADTDKLQAQADATRDLHTVELEAQKMHMEVAPVDSLQMMNQTSPNTGP
jgi:hypothetical protein